MIDFVNLVCWKRGSVLKITKKFKLFILFYFSSFNNIFFKVLLYLGWHLTFEIHNLGTKFGYQNIFIFLWIFYVLETSSFLSPVRFTWFQNTPAHSTSFEISHHSWATVFMLILFLVNGIYAVKQLTEIKLITQIFVLKKSLFFQRSICKEKLPHYPV